MRTRVDGPAFERGEGEVGMRDNERTNRELGGETLCDRVEYAQCPFRRGLTATRDPRRRHEGDSRRRSCDRTRHGSHRRAERTQRADGRLVLPHDHGYQMDMGHQ